MNYKKMTFRASMLGLIVMLFAGLVSCSSDDDDKNIPVEETKVPTTGAIVFLYAATEDELSICDMIAEYTDENGATKTEAITATKWKKQINFSSLPAKGLISIKRTLKANVELEKKSYQFSSHSLLITVAIFDQNKKTVDSATSGSTNSYLSVGKDKVEEYIKKESSNTYYSYVLDKKKNVSGCAADRIHRQSTEQERHHRTEEHTRKNFRIHQRHVVIVHEIDKGSIGG